MCKLYIGQVKKGQNNNFYVQGVGPMNENSIVKIAVSISIGVVAQTSPKQ